MSAGRTCRANSGATQGPPRGGAGYEITRLTHTGYDYNPAVTDLQGSCARADASPPTDTLGHVTPGGSPEGCSTIGTRTERSYPHDRCLRLPVCASVRSPGGRRPVAPVRTDVGDGLVDEPGRE